MITTQLHLQNRVIRVALVQVLKHLDARTLSILMMVALALIGRLPTAQAGSRDSLSLGLVKQKADHRNELLQGDLVVYSATDRFDDGDLSYYVHSSYSIYTTDGKLFKNVENHISQTDELPELVKLAPGYYTVEARSGNNSYVQARVVINAGQQTILDLDR